jgi:hypothetical protein
MKENRRPVMMHEAGERTEGDESASDITQRATARNDNDLLTLTMRLSFARIAQSEIPMDTLSRGRAGASVRKIGGLAGWAQQLDGNMREVPAAGTEPGDSGAQG